MKAPKQHLLEYEILNNALKNVLILHKTDRWYIGDLLRHASWIESLASIGCNITISTNKNYLPIFEYDPRISTLLSNDGIDTIDIGKFDLVIVPSSTTPTYYNPNIRRGIYSCNQNLQYTRNGTVVSTLQKDDLNYFRLATHKFGQTFLPDGEVYKMQVPREKSQDAKKFIQKLFPSSDSSIILFNPSASNQYTRQTSVKKEVENILSFYDAKSIISELLIKFPSNNVLIGTAFIGGDTINYKLMEELGDYFSNSRVRSITDIVTIKDGFSFTDFATLLADASVESMLGNDTGTNIHYAATLNMPSMAIVPTANEIMVKNWKNPNIFQMGSFRWRNTSIFTSIYNLSCDTRINNYANLADAFYYHTCATKKKLDILFTNTNKVHSLMKNFLTEFHLCKDAEGSPRRLLQIMKTISIEFKNTTACAFYFNFTDELKYLETIKHSDTEYLRLVNNLQHCKNINASNFDTVSKTIMLLIEDSNLFKLAKLATKSDIRSDKSQNKNTLTKKLYQKIRSNCQLTKKDLKSLQFKSINDLSIWMHKNMHVHIKDSICKYDKNNKTQILGPWQHKVFIDENKSLILKEISVNKESVYFTKKWTIKSIHEAVHGAGGCIPHQSDVKCINNKYSHLVNKVFTTFGGPFIDIDSAFASFLTNNLSLCISDVSLPTGWITDFLELFVKLTEQGIYNVDMRFIDTGIDKFGRYLVLDVGAFVSKNSIDYKENQKLIKDIFHLGINQFLINRRLFSQFKNGAELVAHYDAKTLELIGLDFSSFSLDWKWGDHDDVAIRSYAKKLKRFIKNKFKYSSSRPVYPLLCEYFENTAYMLLKIRME